MTSALRNRQAPSGAAHTRSADFQSAVAQNCILPGYHNPRRFRSSPRPADCKSAIRQIQNLRYAALSRLMPQAASSLAAYCEVTGLAKVGRCVGAPGCFTVYPPIRLLMRGLPHWLSLAVLLVATSLAPATWAAVSPYLITAPVAQTNYSGDTVTFTVVAGGDAPLQHQWRKNNANLTEVGNVSGSTNSTLTLANLTADDSGTYSVAITNSAGTTNASATLTVFTRLVQNGGFETGSLAPWSVSGNAQGFSIQGTTSAYVHSGSRGARIGPDTSPGYLSQSISTLPGQSYVISFWLKNTSAEATNEFAVWWNGTPVYDQRNLGVFGWTGLQFRVTATSTTSLLSFGIQHDQAYFGLDDVSVLPVPTCQDATNTAGSFAFTYKALAGFRYQAQSATNLTPAVWADEGSVFYSATNITVRTAKPTIYPRQFYRIGVLP